MTTGHSKSTLFLMEQVIVIAVFAFSAAICVYILVASHNLTRDAIDTRYALMAAESAAEVYRAFDGEPAQVASILAGTNGFYSDSIVIIYFDGDWQPVAQGIGNFVLQMALERHANHVQLADISVSRVANAFGEIDELVRFQVAARRLDGDS